MREKMITERGRGLLAAAERRDDKSTAAPFAEGCAPTPSAGGRLIARGGSRIARAIFVLWMGCASACDSNDVPGAGGQGGSSGQGGGASSGGAQAGAAGRYAINRNGDSFTISGVTGLAGGGGGGQSGTAGSGTGGGGTSTPACVLTGPTGTPPASAVCGDGLISPSEQCDDANLLVDDACSATCVVTPRMIAPHEDASTPLPLSGRNLGESAHPAAAGCNRVGVSFLDRAAAPTALKLATYSRLSVAQAVLNYGSAEVDEPNPAIAALDNDTFVAAWTAFDDDELGVRLQAIDPQTTEPSARLFANSEQEFSQRAADVAFDGSQVIVAWVDDSDPINGPDLRYRTFSSTLKPNSDDLVLAATAAVEDHVVLAARDGAWAAAWRSGSSGLETIEIQSGAAHWSVGPFLPGPVSDNPALTFLAPGYLALAFTAGSDESGSGVANTSRLHAAILDARYPGHADSFKVEPKASPYSLLPQISQSEPSVANLGDRLIVGWRSSAIPGAPEGDELWAREISWSVSGTSLLVNATAPERPLLNGGDFRSGDQGRATLLSSRFWPEHRVLSVWEDTSGSLKNLFGRSEVGVQFSRAPSLLPTTPESGPCLDATLSASPSAAALPPAAVKLTAAAGCGGAASAEYKFYYQPPDLGALQSIRDWGGPGATWNTSGLPSGRYALTVYARRAGTSAAFDSYSAIPYNVGYVCNVAPAITSPPANVLWPIGNVLSLSATATCNGATPEYRFQYALPGSSSFTNIGTWSTTPISWNTTGLPSGIFTLFASVRGAGNSSAFESTATTTVKIGNSCFSVNPPTVAPSSPQVVGTTISLSTNGYCTSGATPEFRYSYLPPGGSDWVQIGSWGTSPFAWNTTGLSAGSYLLRAQARAIGNASGADSTSTTLSFALQPGADCTVSLTSTNGPVTVGNNVPLSASASCGANPTYRFAQSYAGILTYLTPWQSANTGTWNTTGLNETSYDLVVFVRKSSTTTSYDGTAQKSLLIRRKCPGAMIEVSPGIGSLLTLSGYGINSYCVDAQYSYFRAPADGNHAWVAVGSPWVSSSVSLDSSTVSPPGVYEFKAEARIGTVGGADAVSDPVLHQVGPGCTYIPELPRWAGHPQAPGTPFYYETDAYCDEGVTPEYAFYFMRPDTTEWELFPGTDWQSSNLATLDTTDFSIGGTYRIRLSARGVGHVGGAESNSEGTIEIE